MLLHKWAVKQSLVGVFYLGLMRLPAKLRPPKAVAFRWSMEAEHIRGLNKKVNDVSARLTKLFDDHWTFSLILKGSANALLYPDSSLRQTGDVDIWVDGGRNRVVDLLKKMGLLKKASISTLHVHLDDSIFDMEVEVHFTAARQYSPLNNDALQRFLAEEAKNSHVEENFRVPSICYALMMQLSHIKQHLFSSGVGLRQLVDYYQLLLHSTAFERAKVASQLKACGLHHMAAAVMWVLQEVLGLKKELMLCSPDRTRGRLLMKVALEGGNFGWYADDFNVPVIVRWFNDRVRFFKLLPFDAKESLWRELHYWMKTISLVPRRLKRGRLALGPR